LGFGLVEFPQSLVSVNATAAFELIYSSWIGLAADSAAIYELIDTF